MAALTWCVPGFLAYPATHALTFHDCEHLGDMFRYEEQLTAAGAEVLGSYRNDDDTDTCVIKIRVATPDIARRVMATEVWKLTPPQSR